MKFGVNLINFGPSACPDSLVRWAMLAETLGSHFLMTSDHLALTSDVQARYPAPFYEPFTTLAWLAGVTHRIEIGSTVVILPYRQPLEVARMAANIDQLSGGRLLFGVGVGWSPQEFAALGIHDAPQRLAGRRCLMGHDCERVDADHFGIYSVRESLGGSHANSQPGE